MTDAHTINVATPSNRHSSGAGTPRLEVWLVIATLVTIISLPGLARVFRTNERRDFEAEWLSARNYFANVAVYEPRDESVRRYPDGPVLRGLVGGETNPHPPTSILVTLPVGLLTYANAFFAWNVVSLMALVTSLLLISRSLSITWNAARVLRVYSLALVCSPLNAQTYHGQLNLLLLIMIVGAWAADRRGGAATAGILLGAATVIKLFPGLLFIFPALQRRWRVLAWGGLTMGALTLATVATLGTSAFRDYFATSAPTISEWRSAWGNLSLFGLWSKLFDPSARQAAGLVNPVWRNETIARFATVASDLALLAVLAYTVARARSRPQRDVAFSLAVIVTLLVSPVLWSHYLVLLLLPIVVLWTTLPASSALRWTVGIMACVLWINPGIWWLLFVPDYAEIGGRLTMSPWNTMTALSIPTYALLGLFVAGVAASRELHVGAAPEDQG